MDRKTSLKHGKVCGGCCCRVSMLLTDAETELLKQFGARSPGRVSQAAVSAMRGLEAKKLIEPIREADRTCSSGDMALTARGRVALRLMKDQK